MMMSFKPSNQFAFISQIILLVLALTLQTVSGYTVAVFGGSGFIGSRVCQTLVQSGANVISVSREGGPPEWAKGQDWIREVDWLASDVMETALDGGDDRDGGMLRRALGNRIDGAVSCVGALEPKKEFEDFWGLTFDNNGLREDISAVNARIIDLSKKAGAKRFSFLSVSYETQKALEGAIDGYIDGKRSVENCAYETFGNCATAIGPSLVFDGKRFPTLGKVYRAFVAGPGKAYVAGNDAVRNLSMSQSEDWLEKMVFSEPVEVEIVARAVVVGVLMGGKLLREGEGKRGGVLEPRRQDFYSVQGEPVTMVNIPFVDGTKEIERIARDMGTVGRLRETIENLEEDLSAAIVNEDVACGKARDALRTIERRVKDEAFEGALVGKKPYLYPFPVIFTFGVIFWGITTQQFNQISNVPIV